MSPRRRRLQTSTTVASTGDGLPLCCSGAVWRPLPGWLAHWPGGSRVWSTRFTTSDGSSCFGMRARRRIADLSFLR